MIADQAYRVQLSMEDLKIFKEELARLRLPAMLWAADHERVTYDVPANNPTERRTAESFFESLRGKVLTLTWQPPEAEER